MFLLRQMFKQFNLLDYLKESSWNLYFAAAFLIFINNVIYVVEHSDDHDFNHSFKGTLFFSFPLLLISILLILTRMQIINKSNKKYRSLKMNNFNELLFSFASVIINKENTEFREIEYKFIENYYTKRELPRFVDITRSKIIFYEGENFDLEGLCERAYWFLTEHQLKYLFYLLYGLSASKGFITERDEHRMKYILSHFKISKGYYNNIKNLFIPKDEPEQQTQNQSINYALIYKLRNAYATLHLTEDAEEQDIKKAYRNLVKQYHPDKMINATEQEIIEAKQQFLQIQDAYEFIVKYKNIK